jgi:hypothetical protein
VHIRPDLRLKFNADVPTERETMEKDSTLSLIEASGGGTVRLVGEVAKLVGADRVIEQVRSALGRATRRGASNQATAMVCLLRKDHVPLGNVICQRGLAKSGAHPQRVTR